MYAGPEMDFIDQMDGNGVRCMPGPGMEDL